MLPFVYNFPFFSIFLCMVSAILLSIVKSDTFSFYWTMLVSFVCCLLSLALTMYLTKAGVSFAYTMGKFPAPFGNEIKAGPLQALLAAVFSFVMFFSLLGGREDFFADVKKGKLGLACVMLNMTLVGLLVLTYTNDIFTGYVFIEISTIAACALVMIKESGETFVATIRYLFMSLLGSGLFLFGIIILYGITGQLLMPQITEAVQRLAATGEYRGALFASLSLITVGLGIKSGMYPFHRWIPWAYGTASTGASAVLSGLVQKGYVVLLITVFCRIFTLDTVRDMGINNLIFVLGLLGMIIGSLYAMKEGHMKKMLAYSSAAQLSYVFMGIGMGTEAGIAAACFQLIAHACTKSLLFLTAGRLSEVTGGEQEIHALRSSAWRVPMAGLAFLVGTLSMIGIPLMAGFNSKLTLALASDGLESLLVLAALGVSSVLNALYYIPAFIAIWSTGESAVREGTANRKAIDFGIAAAALMTGVIVLGFLFAPVMGVIEAGLGLM